MSKGNAFNAASSKTYDVVIVGAGMAATILAYKLKKTADEEGRQLNVLMIGDKPSAPAQAGTQLVRGIEGFFEPGQRQPDAIDTLLRQGHDWLDHTITEGGIECRFSSGYEIKCMNDQQLNERMSEFSEHNIYRPDEMVNNSAKQTIRLEGYESSARMECIGQLNVPDLLDNLREAFIKLGGHLEIPATYLNHTFDQQGGAVIQTNTGTFSSRNKPVIATGAVHAASLPEFPVKQTETVYTMAMTVGPLSEEDARKISSGPVAFCDLPGNQNMTWGSIDNRNMLTLGYGEITDPNGRAALEQELLGQMNKFFPGIADKYPPRVEFGGQMYTQNLMPVVGETENTIWLTGWGGRGVEPAAASSLAIEDALVRNDRSNLRLLEDLQPGAFLSSNMPASQIGIQPTGQSMFPG